MVRRKSPEMRACEAMDRRGHGRTKTEDQGIQSGPMWKKGLSRASDGEG